MSTTPTPDHDEPDAVLSPTPFSEAPRFIRASHDRHVRQWVGAGATVHPSIAPSGDAPPHAAVGLDVQPSRPRTA